MVGVATDMPETPDDILRALADPERLAIAGLLARSNATDRTHRARVRAGRGLRRADGERDRRALSPDHAGLHRYLVDEGFLRRDHGRYWRTGGRVDAWRPDRGYPIADRNSPNTSR
jgi:hypothetical protein